MRYRKLACLFLQAYARSGVVRLRQQAGWYLYLAKESQTPGPVAEKARAFRLLAGQLAQSVQGCEVPHVS